MSVYTLTYTESWAVANLLHLPVQPGSALSGWLNSGTEPAGSGIQVAALDSLAAKGYYAGERSAAPFPNGLLSALALVSVNAAELTTVIRTGSEAGLTRFAQVGNKVVQYGADEQYLYLHDVTDTASLAGGLLPRWFVVRQNENLWADLPLGAFLLFKHACTMADWTLARSGFYEESFGKDELLESFQRSTAWVDLFNDIGMKGVQAVDHMPLADYLSQLDARGYLALKAGDVVEIGAAGKPLAEVFSDPGVCTLTLSMQAWEEKQMESGAFLYGAGRLFLLTYNTGRVSVQQCAGPDSGMSWIQALLNRGSQARYEQYQIPPVPPAFLPAARMPGAKKPAARTPARQAPQRQPAPSRPRPVAPPSPPPAAPAPVAWYYINQGAQAGPVDEATLRNWIAQRRIGPETMVWNQTLPGWVTASQAGLFSPAANAAAPARALTCPRCGAALAPGARFCGQCGQKF